MTHQDYMRECFRLALRGKGQVSPNPMVGAVLVKGGRIVARGYHRKWGGLHAEAECLADYRGDMENATLYVNLEPCSHHGKTPPCVAAILSRGIRNVVAAMEDPNPLVGGRGIRKLRRSRVKTTVGILGQEAQELNRIFIRHITARLPYVHVKIAESRDGRITGGRSRWISSLDSRKRVHALRAEYDAVLVGAGTVRADDPSMTVRLVKGRNPAVVVLDGAFSLAPTLRLFNGGQDRRVFLMTARQRVSRNSARAAALAGRGVEVIGLKTNGRRLPLRRVLQELYLRGIASVLVEGGADVFTQFLSEGLVDELTLFISPDYVGRGLRAVQAEVLLAGRRTAVDRVTLGKSGRDAMIHILYNQSGP